MSQKESVESGSHNDYEGYPKSALSLVIVLVLAIIALGLKALGVL